MHLKDTNMVKGVNNWASGLESYQSSAGLKASFSKEALVVFFFLLSVFVCTPLNACGDAVDWMFVWEHFGSYATLTVVLCISFLLVISVLFWVFFLRLLYRGAIRGEGDPGESRGCPESHSGCGSNCCGDSKRVHLYPSYGAGLRPDCSWGI